MSLKTPTSATYYILKYFLQEKLVYDWTLKPKLVNGEIATTIGARNIVIRDYWKRNKTFYYVIVFLLPLIHSFWFLQFLLYLFLFIYFYCEQSNATVFQMLVFRNWVYRCDPKPNNNTCTHISYTYNMKPRVNTKTKKRAVTALTSLQTHWYMKEFFPIELRLMCVVDCMIWYCIDNYNLLHFNSIYFAIHIMIKSFRPHANDFMNERNIVIRL